MSIPLINLNHLLLKIFSPRAHKLYIIRYLYSLSHGSLGHLQKTNIYILFGCFCECLFLPWVHAYSLIPFRPQNCDLAGWAIPSKLCFWRELWEEGGTWGSKV